MPHHRALLPPSALGTDDGACHGTLEVPHLDGPSRLCVRGSPDVQYLRIGLKASSALKGQRASATCVDLGVAATDCYIARDILFEKAA